LKHFYGDQVVLEYHDIGAPEAYERFQSWLERVPEGFLEYPLVFINGEFKLAGNAEYYEILVLVQDFIDAQPFAS